MPQDDKLEQLYAELHDAMRYDAMSLRALALLLNKNKKNREFMKFASAELGRNARHWARAVDYFPPYFEGGGFVFGCSTADHYLTLFTYASLKHELAIECFTKWKFDYPLHVIRQRVQAAKPKREKRETPGEACAALVRMWREHLVRDVVTGTMADNLADLDFVKRELERKP